ncbi:MAG: cysteine hydrolase [Rhodospirillales bacterium]|nr:cysteine hydrolase [Rhodospirillales bacterium]
MSEPKTLLEIAGAPRKIARWSTAALVLIDHQNEYVAAGKLPLFGVEAARDEIKLLLAAARRHQAPVVHVVHHARPGAPLFDPETANAAIMAGVEPIEGEAVIVKSMPNAFARTDLAERLKALGRPELIVAGFATHLCVSTSVRAALDVGLPTTVVAAACATRDLPDACGNRIPADVVHQVALAELADRFATVAMAEDEIE